jgi:uncharacterized protein YciI
VENRRDGSALDEESEMAYYVLEYTYGDMDARARVRPRHLDYLTGLNAEGKVVMAGPVGDGAGAMVVYQAASEEEARRLVAEDPYTSEGVAVDASLRPWNVVIPPVG